jgi:hypothetical protein
LPAVLSARSRVGLKADRHGASTYRELCDVTLGWTVLAVAPPSLATGLVFGALPAVQSARPDLSGVLRETSRGLTAGARMARVRGVFVVAQLPSHCAGRRRWLLVQPPAAQRGQPRLDPTNVVAVQPVPADAVQGAAIPQAAAHGAIRLAIQPAD